MADIELRLGRDVVVLASPVESMVAATGVAESDFALALLVEPETVAEAYRRALAAGAGCLVTPTAWMTRSRLARMRLENRAPELVKGAFAPLAELRPQHVLAEVGACGLPFDPSSPASLREHRSQYSQLAALLSHETFDGFLLDGFRRLGTVRPALDAVMKVSTRPVFLEVEVDADGRLVDGFEGLEDLVALAREYGVAGVGVRVAFAGMERRSARDTDGDAVRIARELALLTERPLLVTLAEARQSVARIGEEARQAEGGSAAEARQNLDELIEVAEQLRAVGVQFLRAAGPDSGVLETAALAGAVGGMSVVARHATEPDENEADVTSDAGDEPVRPFKPIPEDVIARFSARVDAALHSQ